MQRQENQNIFGCRIIGRFYLRKDKGKCWLKLIGLRAWNGFDGKGNKVMGDENYYCLPKIENASKEIIETMALLSTFSDSQKKEFIDFQIRTIII